MCAGHLGEFGASYNATSSRLDRLSVHWNVVSVKIARDWKDSRATGEFSSRFIGIVQSPISRETGERERMNQCDATHS